MLRLLSKIALLLMVLSTRGATAEAKPAELISGRAEVMAVEKKGWAIMVHDPHQRVAEGNYQLTLRITDPKEHLATARVLYVYEEKELTLAGHALTSGDTISFRATRRVLEGRVELDVLANFQELAVVAKAAAKGR